VCGRFFLGMLARYIAVHLYAEAGSAALGPARLPEAIEHVPVDTIAFPVRAWGLEKDSTFLGQERAQRRLHGGCCSG